MKEENELLRQIVHQNQQVLSRTAKIFEQNQQLIEMLMWERNKIDNTEFGDEFDWNDDRLDTEDEQEEDVEDINRFTSEEMNNMNTGSEPIVAEKEPETEHVEQIFVKCEPLSNDEEDEVMEMWTQKADIRETFSPTLSGPSTQPKATKPASPSIVNLQPEIDPRIISEGVAIFPISTLEELAKIGERMAKEEDFKQTILQYMERVKLNGDSISKLIKNVILARALKLKAADWTIKDVSRKLPFLEELQSEFEWLRRIIAKEIIY